MPNIGDSLREARMRQHLDIADVEARTKIRAKYLRALENEEFGLLPGATFVRTFLRTYAEVIGLDPHGLVEEYRQKYVPRDAPDLHPLGGAPAASGRRERGTPPGPRPGPSRPPNRFAIVVGAVVLVLVFLVVLGLTGGEDKGGGGGRSAQTSTERKKPAKEKKEKPAAKPTSVTLKIVPDGPTYVCLDNGPGTQRVFE